MSTLLKPRCNKHTDTETAPTLCRVCTRLAVEADIVTRTVDAMLAAGYPLTTDAEGTPENDPTADRAVILARLMLVDDEHLIVYTDPGRPSWVYFVYGNDGWDVICDYTVDLEAVLKPINDYAEGLDPR